ncbi:MAG: prepilin peptidase [Proteobacteria bacterium]|nr:prepilin peptidase [Pseudomonadota bacterium]
MAEAFPPALGIVAAALLGLAFGSFATLLVYRLPRGEPVIVVGSRCTACGAALGVRDLAPMVSWLVQRGRCRHCDAPVSARYPLIEALLAVLFVVVYLRAGATLPGVLLAALAVALVTLAVIDLEVGLIPDRILLFVAPLGLVYQLAEGDLVAAVAGGAFAGGLAYLIRFAFLRLRGRDALGLGDVKFFAAAGVWLGPMGLPAFMVISGLGGAIFAVLWRRRGGGLEFPFGPALAVGLFVCLLFPELTRIFL